MPPASRRIRAPPNRLSVSVSASAGRRSALASSASRLDRQRALEQRIGRMDVQMHEAGIQRSALAILRSKDGADRSPKSPPARGDLGATAHSFADAA